MKFLRALFLFIQMYRKGFYFNSMAFVDKNKIHHGYYNFNFRDEKTIFQIAFSFEQNGGGYISIRGKFFEVEWDSKGLFARKIIQ